MCANPEETDGTGKTEPGTAVMKFYELAIGARFKCRGVEYVKVAYTVAARVVNFIFLLR
jgi:hypothetical protein